MCGIFSGVRAWMCMRGVCLLCKPQYCAQQCVTIAVLTAGSGLVVADAVCPFRSLRTVLCVDVVANAMYGDCSECGVHPVMSVFVSLFSHIPPCAATSPHFEFAFVSTLGMACSLPQQARSAARVLLPFALARVFASVISSVVHARVSSVLAGHGLLFVCRQWVCAGALHVAHLPGSFVCPTGQVLL